MPFAQRTDITECNIPSAMGLTIK